MRGVLHPWVKTITATISADGVVVAAFELPNDIESLEIDVDAGTVTGTSPTLDLNLQHSPDGGTTWWTHSRFAQITTTAKRRLSVALHTGPAGSEAAIATTGGALSAAAPISRNVRLYADVGGTNPAYTTMLIQITGYGINKASIY